MSLCTNPFLYVLISAVFTLVLAIVTSRAYPKADEAGRLPGGFSSPVLAFEFVRNQDELTKLFSGPESAKFAKKMRKGHKLDNYFAGVYPLMLLFFVHAIVCSNNWPPLVTGVALVLASVTAFSDIRENKILMALSNENPQSTPAQLRQLNGCVRAKFFALTLLVALPVPFYLDVPYEALGTFRSIGLLAGTLAVLCLPFGVVVAANGRRAAPYLMGLIPLIYLLILLFSLFYLTWPDLGSWFRSLFP